MKVHPVNIEPRFQIEILYLKITLRHLCPESFILSYDLESLGQAS